MTHGPADFPGAKGNFNDAAARRAMFVGQQQPYFGSIRGDYRVAGTVANRRDSLAFGCLV
jgi:hypothetical protein